LVPGEIQDPRNIRAIYAAAYVTAHFNAINCGILAAFFGVLNAALIALFLAGFLLVDC
tara:strand:- start:2307 stop:2480 length:174 start_codon:yes stop_codon:yes gene_type:complete